jgi:hypothetical protein
LHVQCQILEVGLVAGILLEILVTGIHPIISIPVSDMRIKWQLPKLQGEGFEYRTTKPLFRLVGGAAPTFKVPYMQL